jgi:hypothetical protein
VLFRSAYEKFQIYGLARESGADWNIFFDADTLIHPNFPDPTTLLTKDTTCSYGTDFVPIRFYPPEKYFKRDGRWIGKGNWCAIASNWCLDYWHPLDDITFEEAVSYIHPTIDELQSGLIDPMHLIDDYVVSRNIARYGLKHVLIPDLCAQYKVQAALFHQYLVPPEKKVVMMQQQLKAWKVSVPDAAILADNTNIIELKPVLQVKS